MSKTNSVNYTAAGTTFPIATDGTDDLTKEDLFTLQKAVEEHTHDSTRGVAVRRVNTANAPASTGQVRINGDLFQWWAGTSGAVLAAASTGAANIWTADQRFNNPLVLPDQGGAPAAPGAGLNVLYARNGLIYQRSGAAGAERQVGNPPGYTFMAKMFDTLGTAGTWAEQKQVALGATGSYLNWVVAFDGGGATEQADFAFPVPPAYAGTPITFYLQWYANQAGNAAVWTINAVISGTSAALSGAASPVTANTTAANDAVANEKNLTTISWNATLPTAQDWVQARLVRSSANAADTLTVDANLLSLTVVFG